MAYSGFYTITNMASRTRLDLEGGNRADGTKVVAWSAHQPTDQDYLNQVWEIQPSNSASQGQNTFANAGKSRYTIANARTGTYLEAVNGVGDDGAGKDGVQITCSKAGEDRPSYQEWKIISAPWEYMGNNGIVNVASGLLMDVEGG
ncbi:carbohydrate-binding module family 13 protein [Favolaschia claudopus]|uniref:Carbohydrate-binding module family 13 protein n=1 Tax=Favolaschia claudopus TaxID=2862362 RepID=A0AAW0EJZ6_9AGAR